MDDMNERFSNERFRPLTKDDIQKREHNLRRKQPQTFREYLDVCHSLGLIVQAKADQSLTPSDRVYPQRIIPWDEYPKQQKKIWNSLGLLPFDRKDTFPPSSKFQNLANLHENKSISSKSKVECFAKDIVEDHVRMLLNTAFNEGFLRHRYDLEGCVTFAFEYHTNFGGSDEHGPADKFCVCRGSHGRRVLAAINYEAPQEITRDVIVGGLQGEIQPARDTMNQNGEGFAFASKALVAAAISDVFASMVEVGLQYGYIYTGEAIIFLHIPDDPSVVYYYVSVPNWDVLEDDKDRLHQTAVAQIFSFVLQALHKSPPPLSWRDQAENLDTCTVKFEDILRHIPEMDRKPAYDLPPYKPQRWRSFKNSPIKTPLGKEHGDDADEAHSQSQSNGGSDKRKNPAKKTTRMKIEDRPFCTHKCLFTLTTGGPMDTLCPNFKYHQQKHIDISEFLYLIQLQLAEDRGANADSMPLSTSGAIGALFKVCLSSHGYTFVAKGVEEDNCPRLRHENLAYQLLKRIQGQYVPVCLGLLKLDLPYYYDFGVFTYFLFLSWSGRPFGLVPGSGLNQAVMHAVSTAYRSIHKLGVVHCDAEFRNLLYDARIDRVIIIDFERAEVCGVGPPGAPPRVTDENRSGKELSHIMSLVEKQMTRYNSQSP